MLSTTFNYKEQNTQNYSELKCQNNARDAYCTFISLTLTREFHCDCIKTNSTNNSQTNLQFSHSFTDLSVSHQRNFYFTSPGLSFQNSTNLICQIGFNLGLWSTVLPYNNPVLRLIG